MRILTNMYQDCELLNLGFNKNGRGPYVIRQDGVPPDSLHAQEDRFLLRKDGTWVLNMAAYTPWKKSKSSLFFKMLLNCTQPWKNFREKPVVEAALPPGKKSRGASRSYRHDDFQGLEPNARSPRHKVNEARGLKFLLPTK